MMILLLLSQFIIEDSLHISGGYINGAAWDGSYLWVTNNDEAPGTKIHKINPTTGNMYVILTYNYSYTGGGYTGMTYANGFLWPVYWPDDAIWKIDPADGSHDNTYAAPSTPYPYGMAWDGRWFWYTDQNENRLYRIDPSNMISNGNWPLSFSPKDCEFDGQYLYIMSGTNTLYGIDTGTKAVVSSQPFPRSYCAGLAFGGGYMWVGTNAATGKIYKVRWAPVWVAEEPSAQKDEVSLYPNPARQSATLRVPSGAGVTVYDATGREVLRRDWATELAIRSVQIGGPGVYFVVVNEKGAARRLTLEMVK
ncbi:MAG: T9SS type A sorting domain-containing protein [candidate division WOR-3 bacterium]